MTMFEIKHRHTGAVLFSLECGSFKLCVEAAVNAGSNLRGSDLRDSDLRGSDLRGSNLSYSNLRGSDLRDSDLSYSNLRGSDLRDSDLRGSNLSYSNLSYSDLRGSDLSGSNLRDAKNAEIAIAKTRILPEGDLIVWKKAGNHLVKLRIPADAKRSNAFGRKCRAEFADVLEIEGSDVAVTNVFGPRTEYRVGQRVAADRWDKDFTNECSNGIHFFITKIEAMEY